MKRIIAIAAALATSLSLTAQANAAVVISMDQVGSNVVATGSGTIDLTDLSGGGLPVCCEAPSVLPSAAILVLGPFSTFTVYAGLIGPSSFGGGGTAPATSGDGDTFGMNSYSAGEALRRPADYVSGNPLSGTATWDNTTLVGLGVTDGTYVWTWGAGTDADSLTLEIGSAVPELSTWAMMIIGFLGLGWLAHRRRRNWYALAVA